MPVTATPATHSPSTPKLSPSHPLAEDLSFLSRHLGPNKITEKEMLKTVGLTSLEELVQATLPAGLASSQPPKLPPARSETRALADLEKILSQNKPFRSLIGLGYHGTITPPVLRRAIIEDPGW